MELLPIVVANNADGFRLVLSYIIPLFYLIWIFDGFCLAIKWLGLFFHKLYFWRKDKNDA